MKEALRNEEFYEGDNPLEDNDNDKGDNEELTDDDEYSSEEDEEDTQWGKRGVSSSVSHYANMSVQYTAIFHGCKNDEIQMKIFDIFLILVKT